MGLLICIEGVDASGKQTQTELLQEYLISKNIPVRRLSFPMYENESSAAVRMYLSGALGENADETSAYAASTLFAADRFLSFRSDWKKDYDNGTVILCDRYVGSNMIHQACKLPEGERASFLEWLDDFEYGIYGLPRADLTVFLDMPPEYAERLISGRRNKIDNSEIMDIHERDKAYLKNSYDNACAVAEKFGWTHILCAADGIIRTPEDISAELCRLADAAINGQLDCIK